MAVVYVPGVAQLSIGGLIAAQPWATVMHWRDGVTTAPWAQAALNALVASFASAYTSNIRALTMTNVSVTKIQALDIGSATGQVSNYAGSPIVGTETGFLEPSSLCMVVQYRISRRYRGGHPRGFWPIHGIADMADESHWTPSVVTAVQTAFQTFVNSINTQQIAAGQTAPNHCIPRYTYSFTNDSAHHKYLKERTGLSEVVTVDSYAVRSIVGSQRRRLIL